MVPIMLLHQSGLTTCVRNKPSLFYTSAGLQLKYLKSSITIVYFIWIILVDYLNGLRLFSVSSTSFYENLRNQMLALIMQKLLFSSVVDCKRNVKFKMDGDKK